MDEVKLNSASKTTVADIRAQDIRLACIQAAASSSGQGGSEKYVIERAAKFEAFVLRGLDGAQPQANDRQSAWRPDP